MRYCSTQSTGRSERPVGAQQTLQLNGTDCEIIEATEFARLVAADNPLWCAALLTGRIAELGEVLFETPSWRAIRPPSSPSTSTGRTTATRRTLTPRGGSAPFAERWRIRRTAARARPSRRRTTPTAILWLLTLGVAVGAVVGLRDLERPTASLGLRGAAAAERGHAAAADAATKALPRGARGAHEAARLAALDDWLGTIATLSEAPSPLLPPLPPPDPPPPAPAPLVEALAQLELPIPTAEVAHAVFAGSRMYDLATERSDADLHVVFFTPTRELLRLRRPAKQLERKVAAAFGADKAGELECTAIEIGRYVEVLTKGNPHDVELLWTERQLHAAWPWDELVARREQFRNAITFAQYMGYAGSHLHKARDFLQAEGPPNDAAVGKALYHAYHKLHEAARLLRGEPLHVALRGDERAHVRAIRAGPLAAELAPELLIARAEAALSKLRAAAAASPPLPAAADPIVLDDWLLSVRLRRLAADAPPAPTRGPSSTSSGAASALDDADAEVAAHAEEAVGQALWASVLEALRRFEADEDVSIVWATERSSRLIGSHHAGSDCDVCAVFVMRRRKYFQLSAPRSTLRAAYAPADGSGAGGEVTICAYEARHACSLLAESNPTLVEALRSPLVYVARAGWLDGGAGARHGLWLDEARRLLDAHVNVGALAVAWARASKQNFITHVRRKGDAGVLRKKYVHVLRQLLAARYLIDRGGGDGDGGGTAVASRSPACAGRGDGAGGRGARAHRNARARRAAGARDGWTADRDARFVHRHQPAGARRGGRAQARAAAAADRRPRGVRRALCAHGRGGECAD